MPRRGDPRRADEVYPDVSLLRELWCPGVEPDANAHVQPARPCVVAQPSLRLEGRGDGSGGVGEDGADLVAGGIDLTALLPVDGGAHDAAHVAEHVAVDRPGFLYEPCRALDVREEKRDGAGRKGGHAMESRQDTRCDAPEHAPRVGAARARSPRRSAGGDATCGHGISGGLPHGTHFQCRDGVTVGRAVSGYGWPYSSGRGDEPGCRADTRSCARRALDRERSVQRRQAIGETAEPRSCQGIGSSDPVVGDRHGDHTAGGVDADVHRSRLCVLRYVRERFGDDVVDGRRDSGFERVGGDLGPDGYG